MKNIKPYIVHILVIVSTVFALILNALAIALPLNNRSTQEISDSFQVFFVPAGYVFGITWSLIYIGLIMFAIYQATKKGREDLRISKIRIPFILSNIFNGVWIIFWHYDILPAATVTMLLLLGTLIYIYSRLPYWSEPVGRVLRITTLFSFSLYVGWISVATIANITMQLFDLGWNGFNIGGEYWAALMCLVAADIAINLLWIRRDYIYASIIMFATFGIYVKFAEVAPLAITTIVAVIIVALTCLYFLYRSLVEFLNNKKQKSQSATSSQDVEV